MIGRTCAECGTIHAADSVAAVGRFTPPGPTGYRARLADAPLRDSREAALADVCAARVAGSTLGVLDCPRCGRLQCDSGFPFEACR